MRYYVEEVILAVFLVAGILGVAAQNIPEGEYSRFNGSDNAAAENDSFRIGEPIEGSYILEYDLDELDSQNSGSQVGTLSQSGTGIDNAHNKVKEALGISDGFGTLSAGSGPNFETGYENVFKGSSVSDVSKAKAKQLRKLDFVENVHKDRKVHVQLDDSTDYLNTPNIWDGDYSSENLTGEGVSIAILDSGVDYTHPDLGGCTSTEFLNDNCDKVVEGYDFHNGDSDPMDDRGHGTHVAATAAGNGTLKGIAPGADIYAYKVLGSDGSGSTSTVIDGVDQAVADGADIISMSLGSSGQPSDPLPEAVTDAVESGVPVVTSAGNSGPSSETVTSPGNAYKAISVGASINNNSAASVSDFEVTSPNSEEMDSEFLIYSNYDNQSFQSIQSDVVYAQDATSSSLSSIDVSGSIAVFDQDSDIDIENQLSNLQSEGAVAAVTSSMSSNRLGNQVEIPAITVSSTDHSTLVNDAQNEDLIAELNLTLDPDRIATFSSRGPVLYKNNAYAKPDIVAPGVAICAAQYGSWYEAKTCTNGDHIEIDGTSMAAPHVSGAAALLMQKNSDWSPAELKSALTMPTNEIGTDFNNQGEGRLNLTRSVQFSNPPVVRVNTTGIIRGTTDIKGKITGNVDEWSLQRRDYNSDNNWNEIKSGTGQVNSVIKNDLSTENLADGWNTLRLLVNSSGYQREERVYVDARNVEITSPNPGEVYDQDKVNLKGYALDENFQSFSLRSRKVYGNGTAKSPWSTSNIDVNNSNQNKDGTLLGEWYPPEETSVYEIQLLVETSNGQKNDSIILYHDPNLVDGWPSQLVGDSISGSFALTLVEQPVTKDVNGDGHPEIFVAYDDTAVLADYQGNKIWEKTLTVDGVQRGPVIGDVNDDGGNEFITGTTGGELHVLDDNGNYVSGYPQVIAGDWILSFSTSDIDTDGKKELIVGDKSGKIHITDDLSNFNTIDTELNETNSVKTVADITGDGDKEILALDNTEKNLIAAIDNSGNQLWNYSFSNSGGAYPVVSDLDFDGEREIFVKAGANSVDLLDSSGNSESNFPVNVGWKVNSFALADVNADGYPELVVGHGDDYGFTTIDRNGNELGEYTRLLYSKETEFGKFKVAGRGDDTVIFGGQFFGGVSSPSSEVDFYRLNAFTDEGQLDTFPRYSKERIWRTGYIDDFTNDGSLEWMNFNFVMNGFLYDLPVNTSEYVPQWNTVQRDSYKGLYPTDQLPPVVEMQQNNDSVVAENNNTLNVSLIDRNGLDYVKIETNSSGVWSPVNETELSGEQVNIEHNWTEDVAAPDTIAWRVFANNTEGAEIVTEPKTFEVVGKVRADPRNVLGSNISLVFPSRQEFDDFKLATNETGTLENRSFQENQLGSDVELTRSISLGDNEKLNYTVYAKDPEEGWLSDTGLYPSEGMEPAINLTQQHDIITEDETNNLSFEAWDWKEIETVTLEAIEGGFWQDQHTFNPGSREFNDFYEWTDTSGSEVTWRLRVNNTDGTEAVSNERSFSIIDLTIENGTMMETVNVSSSRNLDLQFIREEKGLDYTTTSDTQFQPRNVGTYKLNFSIQNSEGWRVKNFSVDSGPPEFVHFSSDFLMSSRNDTITFQFDAPYINESNSSFEIIDEDGNSQTLDMTYNPTSSLTDSTTGEQVPEGGCQYPLDYDGLDTCTDIKTEIDVGAGNYTLKANVSNNYSLNTVYEKDIEVLSSIEYDPEVKRLQQEYTNITYYYMESDNTSHSIDTYLEEGDNQVVHALNPAKGYTYSNTIYALKTQPLGFGDAYVAAEYNEVPLGDVDPLKMDLSNETTEDQGLKLYLKGIVSEEIGIPNSFEMGVEGGSVPSSYKIYGCKEMSLTGCNTDWEVLDSDPGGALDGVDLSSTYTGFAYGEPSSNPFFEVEVLNTNSPVVEGETLQVDLNVSNPGGSSDVQNITLDDFSGTERDRVEESLSSGGFNDSITLEWNTQVGDHNTGDVNISSEDDYITPQVNIQEDAFFDVNITDVNDTVEGKALEVEYEVENTGDVQGTKDISLKFEGAQVATDQDVTVSAGSTQTGTLSYETVEGDEGSDLDVEVISLDDSDVETVNIDEAWLNVTEVTPQVSGGVDPVAGGNRTVSVETQGDYTVGYDQIEDVNISVERPDGSAKYQGLDCGLDAQVNSTAANWSCSFQQEYFDTPGTWEVNVTAYDQQVESSLSETYSVNSLEAVNVTSGSYNSAINPASASIPEEGVKYENLGNVELDLEIYADGDFTTSDSSDSFSVSNVEVGNESGFENGAELKKASDASYTDLPENLDVKSEGMDSSNNDTIYMQFNFDTAVKSETYTNTLTINAMEVTN